MDKISRKLWNENHRKLKEMIQKPEQHTDAISLFLSQHALLHHESLSHSNQPTLETALRTNLEELMYRKYPVSNPDTKNSIAWHLWHISRIEDMSMNILVADTEQVLTRSNWLEKMNISFPHSGNDMSEAEIAELSIAIHIPALLEYRKAVGRQTQTVVSSLEAGQMKLAVEHRRIQRLFAEQAVSPQSQWLTDYWSKKTIAGLLLMPATRHIFLHLNKAIRIKEKLQRYREKIPNENGKDAGNTILIYHLPATIIFFYFTMP
ncbi:DinB family protein [Caldibacillus lycopersici]|uniref:DinB family protein n=1 Tax=Perspicuibacillus lycopersici TaxID=1325689 RepID=A0AAE3IUF7_9BACI|nr:DinB family protein [Perspicuibacillus lycopersici]MCU9614840.1 DinB family protein [Perspicuibacillus lycopersici]